MRQPRVELLLMASCLLLPSPTVSAEAEAPGETTYYIAQEVKTSKGKLPPCSPLSVVEDRGKKLLMRMESGAGSSFSVAKKQVESDRHPTIEQCIENAETGLASEALLRPLKEGRVSVGDPIEVAQMALGPTSDLDSSFSREREAIRVWQVRRPTRGLASRYVGAKSLSWARLASACLVRVGSDREGRIATIAMEECLPIASTDPPAFIDRSDLEHLSGLAHAAYLGNRHTEAIQIWLELASLGHAPSQFILASHLFRGESIEKDLRQAARWFREASEQHYLPATYQLGLMHLEGIGVDRDSLEAYRFFEAAGKFRDAEKLRDRLETALSPEQIAEATSNVRPGYIEPSKRIESSYVSPTYPVAARIRREGGTVALSARILSDGSVDELVVLSCSNPGVGLEFSALDAVAHWRYEPATRNRKAISIYAHIVVDYSLHG